MTLSRGLCVTAGLLTAAFSAMGGSRAQAAPCGMASYDTYLVAGFSCTIDDKTFSSFSYNNTPTGGATPVPATSITVVPLATPLNPGLRWAFGGLATTGQTNDLFFDFTVTVNPNGRKIKDAFESVTGGAHGDGFVTLDELIADGIPLPSLHAGENVPGLHPSDHVTFDAPQTTLDVTKDLFLSGGTVAGSNARASAVTNRFSEVGIPEPTSLALLGTALVGLGLLRRHRSTH